MKKAGKGKQKKRNQRKRVGKWILFVGILALLFWTIGAEKERDAEKEVLSQELQMLQKNNEEAAEFVENYPERERFLGGEIDLSEDYLEGEVPLLMQWDKRWGYDSYGDSIIGLSGCGPCCLTMAYLYFTGDIQENPRSIASMAEQNGYYTEEGTSWGLWTKGVELLGLVGQELPLDENKMKRAIEQGELIVCSMRPGNFTTTGHYILIVGYGDQGFWVNDPNRRSNSEVPWKYSVMAPQIKNLWALGKK